MVVLKPMYKGVPGDFSTTLTTSFNASSDTSMSVYDASIFPAAPNWVTVRMSNKSCLATFKYTGITENNTITGLTFVESDLPIGETATYPAGSKVYWSVTNVLMSNMIDNITQGGGGSGTTDYEYLENKPQINGHELIGNKTAENLDLASSDDLDAETTARENADSVLMSALSNKVDKIDGKGLSTNDYTTAEKTKLAGIEEGAQKNINADWNATSGDAQILNKPTIPTKTSELTNDSGFQTASEVAAAVTEHDTSETAHSDIRSRITAETNARITADTILQEAITEQLPLVYVPQTRTINTYPLSSDISLTATDVNALESSATLADLPDDSTHRTVTDTEKAYWNNKQDALTIDRELDPTSDNPVTNKVITNAVNGKLGKDYTSSEDNWIAKVDPTDHVLKVMAPGESTVTFANIEGQPSDNTNLATALNSKVDKVNGKQLSTEDYTTAEQTKLSNIEDYAQKNVQSDWNAVSGDALILNKPDIPTKVSELTNDSGYQTSSEVDAKVSAHDVSDDAHSSLFAGKLSIEGEYTPGQIAKVDSDGKLKVMTAGTTSVGWNDVQDKPFSTVSTGLTVDSNALKVNVGTAADTICAGDDSRLSDARSPTTHASTHTDGTDDIQTANTSQKGLLSSADWNTFNSKQNALTFDDTPTESSSNPVKSGGVYSSLSGKVDKESGKSLVLDTEITKLSGIAAGAEVNIIEIVKVNGSPLTITDKAVDVTVTKEAVGLGNVENTADADKPVSTATQTALDAKLGTVYTSAEDGWIAKVDSSDHKLKVMAAGTTSVTFADITGQPEDNTNLSTALARKEPVISTKGTAFNKDFGSTSGTVCEGNDARLSDSRAPTAHASTHTKSGSDALSLDANQITTGTFAYDRFPVGTASGNLCAGDDSRLSDARTPTTHASSHTDGTDDIQTASASQKGLLSSSDWSTFNGKQDEITSSNKLLSDLVDTTSQTNLFVTSSEKTTWNGKQDAITSSSKLSADLVDDTSTTNKFMVLGTTASTACAGNDSRLSDARTPLAHVHSGSDITSGTISTDRLPVATTSGLGVVKVGTGLSITSDGTLSSDGLTTVSWGDVTGKPDTFPPSAHASSHGYSGTDEISISGLQITSGTVDIDRLPITYDYLTLLASGWDANNCQTISVSGAKTDNIIFISPNVNGYEAYANSRIKATGQAAGTITFECSVVPVVDITVNVVFMG